eukprot:7922060-Alexandrium_andersonii.AAC.1
MQGLAAQLQKDGSKPTIKQVEGLKQFSSLLGVGQKRQVDAWATEALDALAKGAIATTSAGSASSWGPVAGGGELGK